MKSVYSASGIRQLAALIFRPFQARFQILDAKRLPLGPAFFQISDILLKHFEALGLFSFGMADNWAQGLVQRTTGLFASLRHADGPVRFRVSPILPEVPFASPCLWIPRSAR